MTLIEKLIPRESLIAMVGGPIIWGAHFLTVYVFNAVACAFGFATLEVFGVGVVTLVVAAATAAALVLIAGAGALGVQRWREDHAELSLLATGERRAITSPARFLALTAVLLAGLSFIATAWVALPAAFLPPCD